MTSAHARGYTRQWSKARAAFLKAHPLCVYCQRDARLTPAEVVDHVVPHKGDAELFWDRANWQPLCKRCHDSIKAREERGRVRAGWDAQGRPTDPLHPWARENENGSRG